MPWTTHDVTNVVPELKDIALYGCDLALQEALQRGGAQAYEAAVAAYGTALGREQTLRWAEEANRYKPELHSFDRSGHRIDVVTFHPAWHAVMAMFRAQNLVSLPFSDPRPGAWSAYAAGFYLHAQVEDGSLCPGSMTFASIPVLQQEPVLFAQLAPKLYAIQHDARDLPIPQKDAILIGMGMTEKQGGSDVRSNTTVATPIAAASGRGAAYRLVGHKWFFSAPMCDAHLVLARAEGGLSCFYVPRFTPDGEKNAVRIQRLKDKLGNCSNASSEVELQDAWGLMVGEEGRGIPTILAMAGYTRLHCVIGSAGMLRQALLQALHHARHRQVFGKPLLEQPLMQSVLADMALESEAATQLMMQLAQAFGRADEPLQRAYQRIVTPAAKFWVCKRGVELAGEAMEVLGGNGYVEDGPLARLFRGMPVNSIWEGSGNVMCLDVLRAIRHEPAAWQLLLDELALHCGGDARLQPALLALQTDAALEEAGARLFAQNLVLLVQASLLLQHAPGDVADAFIASRFGPAWGRVYGCLPPGLNHAAILARAWGEPL
ncbi:putative acyl-CoA dehydrogenase [Rhodoferax ferrireducens]|uniref:Acyl-CoA dehydrogenase n=1 Tax=Rhodoferax ferrireducens TaxID=192843 RepID=A0ABU2C5Z6_9BURK|nr:isovaleryl-CoA dehydrogenase [Rhodoferax ferrireducens]MDR7376751.1 putative acyl-CoA dehydrogenase [Rhodoferax ferrireducens]